jgi:hypothetical protein
MKRILILLMLLALPMAATAGEVQYDAQERVVNLPQDGGLWYVTLFGDATSGRYAEVQSWLRSDFRLQHLISQCHYNEYSTNDIRFRARYAANIPGLPCVRIQNSMGQVVSEWWGEYLPVTADSLYNGIRDDLLNPELFNRRRCNPCPRRPCPGPVCPRPNPKPEPEPKPEPPNDKPPVLPPADPEPEPKRSTLPPWWAMLTAAVLGAGFGVVQEWQKLYFSGQTASKF